MNLNLQLIVWLCFIASLCHVSISRPSKSTNSSNSDDVVVQLGDEFLQFFHDELEPIDAYLTARYQSDLTVNFIESIEEMLEDTIRVNSDLLGAVVSKPHDHLLRGINVDLMQNFLRSIRAASESCTTESMDFMKNLMATLKSKEQFLHVHVRNLRMVCIEEIAYNYLAGVRVFRNNLKAQLFESMRELELERRRQLGLESSSEIRVSELDLTNISLTPSKLGDFAKLIKGAFDKSQIRNVGRYMILQRQNELQAWLKMFLNENFTHPCASLMASANALPENLRRYESYLEAFEAAFAKQRDSPTMRKGVLHFEAWRICIEIKEQMAALWEELEHSIDADEHARESSSKIASV